MKATRMSLFLDRRLLVAGAVGMAVGLGGCASAPPGAEFHDPFEATNRKGHEFNRNLDQVAVRPAGLGTSTFEEGSFDWVVNFSDNASLPGKIVNNVLQGDAEGASTNTMRFVVNTILGLGGLVDWAGEFGLYEADTDFGATLAHYGVPEGAYLELPFIGPSTQRDAVGEIVDILIDPLDEVGTLTQRRYALPAKVGEIIVERGDLGGTYDSILHESADSYAQTRLLYLQNRRYELGQAAGGAAVDPYAAASQPGVDPYAIDPYAIDPYAELPQ